MVDRYAVVITTINHPTRAVQEIARDCAKLDAEFVLIGDSKSPTDFYQAGAKYLDLDAQLRSGFHYAKHAPARHYARKNVGYLEAIRSGATVLIETDDDNIPFADFWQPRSAHVLARRAETKEWLNVYKYFSDGLIWPRGFPLDRLHEQLPELGEVLEGLYCPIQQGLADQNPDVDAIYRLVLPLPFEFRADAPVALAGAWCPFNSQNTTWWPDAFPLLYLPYYCSFRMTDIWRSFVAQRIAYLNGWNILFHGSTVFQERNEHDLTKDFEDEVPGYLNNNKIKNALEQLNLRPGRDHIPEAMRRCYARLTELDLVGRDEARLVDLWLDDLDRAMRG